MAIQALTYCIQHNDMFSVQYDVEKPATTAKPSKENAVTSANNSEGNIR